jgi:hypothetical protein
LTALWQYIIPKAGIKAGSTFGYGVTMKDQSGEWAESEEEKLFDLSAIGPDSLLVYCMTSDKKPFFLSALANNDRGFSEPGQLSYDLSETALPNELAEFGGLVLPFAPNYYYAGSKEGKRDELLEAFYNPANFQGSPVSFEIDTSAGVGFISFAVPFFLCLMVVWL